MSVARVTEITSSSTESFEDAIEQGIAYLTRERGMDEEDAYMLLSLVGDLAIGTSPRPIMGVRVVLPRTVLAQLGGGDA